MKKKWNSRPFRDWHKDEHGNCIGHRVWQLHRRCWAQNDHSLPNTFALRAWPLLACVQEHGRMFPLPLIECQLPLFPRPWNQKLWTRPVYRQWGIHLSCFGWSKAHSCNLESCCTCGPEWVLCHLSWTDAWTIGSNAGNKLQAILVFVRVHQVPPNQKEMQTVVHLPLLSPSCWHSYRPLWGGLEHSHQNMPLQIFLCLRTQMSCRKGLGRLTGSMSLPETTPPHPCTLNGKCCP